MTLQENLAYLGNFKQFGAFLSTIKSLREASIAEMASASTERLQQISGQIIAFDEILRLADAETIIARTSNMP